ncbi:MAG: methyltransferase domain-containing protein [Candidatus Omnitrophica bacterium]|nr:methyltransferase domain-containing protein [Candidatus Omnitrophota bacterium]
MIELHHRSDFTELIDDRHIDSKILRQTYQQINRINVFTLGYWPTLDAVKYFLTQEGHDRVLKILDIGCGDGEILRRIDDYGRKRKLSLELTGIDLNREAVSSAADATTSPINFIHGDIFSLDECLTYDLIINSLTMHHLTNQEIIKLMRWMTTHARKGWFISDLNRHPIPYYFIKYFVKMVRFNPIICHDAPLSVARGFKRREWVDLLTQAKMDLARVKISWYPNFRYGVRYEK